MTYQTRDYLSNRIVPPIDRNLGKDVGEDLGSMGMVGSLDGAHGGETGGETGGSVGGGEDVGTKGTKGGGARPQGLTYAQVYEKLNKSPYLSPEEEAKERKRERRQKLFASIGDGISALSNLYFTTKGAPNMYDSRQSQSGKVAAYWDKVRQDRENDRRRYVDGYIKAAQADNLAAIRKQAADTQQAAKEADAKRKDELAQAQGEVYKARAAKDAAATAMSEKTLDYMNTYGWPLERAKAQASIDLMKSRAGQADASATKSLSKAASGGGGKSSGSKYYGTFNGVAYKSKADYDKAVVSYAKGNKIPITYDKVSTDKYGRRKTTQANRTVAGLASDGEARYRASHVVKPTVKAAPTAKKTYAHTKQLGL